MEVVIGQKRFRLDVWLGDNPQSGKEAAEPATQKTVYHSDGELSELLICSAFYNACLRWVSGENIAKRLEYEFLICLTGETQLNRLLKKTVCSPETHTPTSKHYYFSIVEEAAKTDTAGPASRVPRTTKQDRLKLAEIQLKLLSKSP